jgi:hypothetical protein
MRNERRTPRPQAASSRLSCLCAAILLTVLPGREASRAGQDVPSLLGTARPAVQVDRALDAAFERTGVAAASTCRAKRKCYRSGNHRATNPVTGEDIDDDAG